MSQTGRLLAELRRLGERPHSTMPGDFFRLLADVIETQDDATPTVELESLPPLSTGVIVGLNSDKLLPEQWLDDAAARLGARFPGVTFAVVPNVDSVTFQWERSEPGTDTPEVAS